MPKHMQILLLLAISVLILPHGIFETITFALVLIVGGYSLYKIFRRNGKVQQ